MYREADADWRRSEFTCWDKMRSSTSLRKGWRAILISLSGLLCLNTYSVSTNSTSNELEEMSGPNEVRPSSIDASRFCEASDARRVCEASDARRVCEASDARHVREASDARDVREESDARRM